jgi:hypothetical protein
LSAAVSTALGVALTVTSIDAVGGGANNATHFKLQCADGRIVGLKVSARGVANGTKREYLTAFAGRELGLAGALRCGLLVVPAAAPLIGGKEAVAIEWAPGSVALGSAGAATAARQSPTTARQLGGWMWLALGLGVGDRHAGNWIWSEQEQVFAMIDFEEWQPGSLTAAQLRPIAEMVLGAPINAATAAEVLAGMLAVARTWVQQKAAIEVAFAGAGEALPASIDTLDCLLSARNLTGVTQLALPQPSVDPAGLAAPSLPLP